MTAQSKVEFVAISDAPPEHRPAFEAMSRFSCWGGSDWSKNMAAEMPSTVTVADVKAAGKWLGDRVMVLDSPLSSERFGVRCRRDRWSYVSGFAIECANGMFRNAFGPKETE